MRNCILAIIDLWPLALFGLVGVAAYCALAIYDYRRRQ